MAFFVFNLDECFHIFSRKVLNLRDSPSVPSCHPTDGKISCVLIIVGDTVPSLRRKNDVLSWNFLVDLRSILWGT